MASKIIVLLILAAILASLGSGLYYLMKDKGQGTRTLKALTLRIGLSVTLFLLLFILYAAGLIQPHGALPIH